MTFQAALAHSFPSDPLLPTRLAPFPRPTPSHPAHSFLPGPLLPTRPAPFPPAHSFPPGPSCQTVRERDKTSIYILTGNSCTKKGGVCIKGRYKPCPNGFEACGRCGKGKKNKKKRCCCLLYLPPTGSQVPSRESGMTKPVRIPDLLFARWRRNESGPQLP